MQRTKRKAWWTYYTLHLIRRSVDLDDCIKIDITFAYKHWYIWCDPTNVRTLDIMLRYVKHALGQLLRRWVGVLYSINTPCEVREVAKKHPAPWMAPSGRLH